jgi:hypothetical protein
MQSFCVPHSRPLSDIRFPLLHEQGDEIVADHQVVTIRGSGLVDSVLQESVVSDFRAALQGLLMCIGEPGYDDARQIWNGMIDRRPALIARCRGVADIIGAVNFAREHNLLVAVRGGVISTGRTNSPSRKSPSQITSRYPTLRRDRVLFRPTSGKRARWARRRNHTAIPS